MPFLPNLQLPSHAFLILNSYFFITQSLPAIFENGHQFVNCRGSEHGYTRLTEVGNALEYGCGGEMTARVQYAAILVYALHVDAQLLLKDVQLAVEVEFRVWFLAVKIVANLLEIHG